MAIFIPDENGDLTAALDQASVKAAQTAPQMASGDLGAAFAKMMIGLVVIIFLLVVSYWILKKLLQQRLQKGSHSSAIQILEKRMISPKTMLYLVEVGKKKVLLAESHLEVKRIESFEEPI